MSRGLIKKYEFGAREEVAWGEKNNFHMSGVDYIEIFKRWFKRLDLGEVPIEKEYRTDTVITRPDGQTYTEQFLNGNLKEFLKGIPGLVLEEKPKTPILNNWHLYEMIDYGKRVGRIRGDGRQYQTYPRDVNLNSGECNFHWEVPLTEEERLHKGDLDLIDEYMKAFKEEWEEQIRLKLLGMENVKEVKKSATSKIVFSGEKSIQMSPESYEQLCSCPIK